MRAVAQFALASAAVLATLATPAPATELQAHPRTVAVRVAPSLPKVFYGPGLPQYLPVRPSYLVDQGPSDDFPTNPYGTPMSYAQPLDYGYVDTDYVAAGVGYDGYYAFSRARRHYRHHRAHEHGVAVYRGAHARHGVSHWGAYRQAAWHGHAYRHAGGGAQPWRGHGRPTMGASIRRR